MQIQIKEGEFFASLDILKSFRLEREDAATRYRNKVVHPINSEK